MRVFAYSCESFEKSARRAAGIVPVTCPPVDAGSFILKWLENCDYIYFDLHGEPGTPLWFGDNGTPALLAEQLRDVELNGAVVFAVNCHLADKNSPMMDALLEAGASYVIGGEGSNWSSATRPTGAAELGNRIRQLMERGMEPLSALMMAKRWLTLIYAIRSIKPSKKSLAIKDALEFRAYYRRKI